MDRPQENVTETAAQKPTDSGDKPSSASASGGSGINNNHDHHDSQVASDPRREAERLMAAGDYAAAAAVPGAPAELVTAAQAKLAELANLESSPAALAAGSAAAPAAATDGNEPDKAPASPAAAPASPSPKREPGSLEVLERAAEAAVPKAGLNPHEAMEARTAAFNSIKLSVVTGGSPEGKPVATEERAAQQAETAGRLNANAATAIQELVKAGSFPALWSPTGSIQDLGTGSFAALGSRNPPAQGEAAGRESSPRLA